MGRPPTVHQVRDGFLAEIVSATTLIQTVRALPQQSNPNQNGGIHPKQTDQVIGLAFMGMVAAWEEFLERVLVRYVAGAKTNTNYSPTPKVGKAKGIPHAYEILSQNPNFSPQKNFLKVTDVTWITKTADFLFTQHPFSCLTQKVSVLKHASAIRNRIAHDSEKCKEDFKKTALHFLQPQNGQLVQGFGPGALLRAPVRRDFDQVLIAQSTSHFDAYADLFRQLASNIAP